MPNRRSRERKKKKKLLRSNYDRAFESLMLLKLCARYANEVANRGPVDKR